MLQVFLGECVFSFYQEAKVIVIPASLILLILLSLTHYLPPRLKITFMAMWNEVLGSETASDIGGYH